MASEFCGHHHLDSALLQALDTRISAIVLRASEAGWVSMLVSLQTPWGKEEAAVDAVAVLAITLHLGVPIYADEDCLVPESESAVAHSLNNAQDSVAVPPVFRDLVETLDWLPTPESEG